MTNGGDLPTDLVWPLLGSLAGSVTSLGMRSWQEMSRGEKAFAIFMGFSFSYFVGPFVVELIGRFIPLDPRLQGGVYYVLATGWNSLMPLAVERLRPFVKFLPGNRP